MRRRGDELEFQEVLLDQLTRKHALDDEGERRLEVPLSRGVLRGLLVCFVILSSLFLFQTLQFQVFHGKEFAVLAADNAIRKTPLLADRGIIYDQHLVKLAQNQPSFSLVCDLRDMPHEQQRKEEVLSSLARVLGISLTEARSRINETGQPTAVIGESLSHEELVLAESQEDKLSGCEVQETARRSYLSPLFAHILGYTSKITGAELAEHPEYFTIEQTGKMGVEKSYEELLRGVPGNILTERDANGTVVREAGQQASVSGDNLVLWLDAGLQEQIGAALKQTFEATTTRKAAAVALDPRTGGVLALLSLPSFDNNKLAEGVSRAEWNVILSDPDRSLFNRVISGIGYPTGSVIKPIIGVGALEEGIITASTRIFAPLELCTAHQYTGEETCFRDWAFHGMTDIRRAIAESVNTFFYIVGGGYEDFRGLGPDRIREYLQRFGWGKKTGIDLPGEGEGILPEFTNQWRLGDTYHLSIGQGPFSIPPLQVASAFAAIANKGTLYVPHVLQRFTDQAGKEQWVDPVVIDTNMVSSSALETVRQGMRQVVTSGSTTGWLDQLPVEVAAKTGTAQTGRKTSDGKDYLYSWTVAFAPYENPEIVLVVAVENVREGQVASLPVARDVLQWYFRDRN